ncbi:hypothetical protein ACE10X_29650 [Bradyrhizobium sp. Pha-3]
MNVDVLNGDAGDDVMYAYGRQRLLKRHRPKLC